jgi:hypothetical protein
VTRYEKHTSRFLGVWLARAGFAYVILSLTGVLLPQYSYKVYAYCQPAHAHPSFRAQRGIPLAQRLRAALGINRLAQTLLVVADCCFHQRHLE